MGQFHLLHKTPKDWQKNSVGHLIIEQPKSSFNVSDASDFGSYPFFTSGELILRHNQMLVDGENLYIADGGVADIKFYDGESSYSNHTYTVKTTSDIDTKFLYYCLISIREYINNNYFQGTGLKNLQKKDFKKHELCFPKNIEEQKRIAALLTQLDDIIVKTESLINKYRDIKNGLMQDLLTKGIDSNNNVRSEATHKFKDSELGRIPEEWNVKKLDDLITAIDPQPDHRTPLEFPNGVPYLGISDVTEWGEIDYSKCRRVHPIVFAKQQKLYKIHQGDIIFGKIGTIGKPKKLPSNCEKYALSANIILIQPTETPEYLYWCLETDYVRKQIDLLINSTSQPAFGMQKIRQLQIMYPSKAERLKISNLINEAENQIKQLWLEYSKYKNLRTGLLRDLLSGNIRIPSTIKL